MSSRQIFAALILLSASFGGCDTGNHHRDARMEEAAKFRYHIADSLDEDALLILDQAQRAQSFEVARPRPAGQVPAAKLVGGAPLVSEGPELDSVAIKDLRELIFSDFHYTLDRKKRVPFIPQVAFVLETEKTAEEESKQVTVLVALFTAQLRFVYEDKQVTVDCDPIIDEWRRIATQFVDVRGLDEIPQ